MLHRVGLYCFILSRLVKYNVLSCQVFSCIVSFYCHILYVGALSCLILLCRVLYSPGLVCMLVVVCCLLCVFLCVSFVVSFVLCCVAL